MAFSYKPSILMTICIIVIGITGCIEPGADSEDITPPADLIITEVITAENMIVLSWEVSSDSDFHHTEITCSNSTSQNVSSWSFSHSLVR